MKMNLWVRSQDKELLMKSPELRYNQKGNDYSILAYDSLGVYRILGTYKTKERALEVLDEIEERIMLINTINIVKDRDSLIAYKNALPEEKIKGLSYPYQMPEN